MKYTPFGETRSTSGSVPTDRRFTGQRQEDSGLGSLYDYGARFYSPLVGRFLSANTIVPDGKNPQQYNRYAYGLNNPLNHIDPTGHFTDDELINKLHVFNGPNQIEQMKNDPNTALWYWVLRAADSGDQLSLPVSEWNGFDAVSGVNSSSGRLESTDNGLMFAADGGAQYRVSWSGLVDTADSGHVFNYYAGAKLTKPDGTTLSDLSSARRYAQIKQYGYRGAMDLDYYQAGFSAYVGVGGGVSLQVDRYGHVYATLSIGVGLGGKGPSLTGGAYQTVYKPDEVELQNTMTGASVSGGYGLVGWVDATLPSEGPIGGDLGVGFVGGYLSVNLTVQLH